MMVRGAMFIGGVLGAGADKMCLQPKGHMCRRLIEARQPEIVGAQPIGNCCLIGKGNQ